MNKTIKLALFAMSALLCTSKTWAQWAQKSSGTSQDLTGILFLNASTGFACGAYNTLIKTTDGGASWQPIGSGQIPLTSYSAIDALSTSNLFVARKGLFVTENGGAVWSEWGTLSSSSGTILAMKVLNDSTAFVMKDGNILKTTSKGAAWVGVYSANYLAGPMQFMGNNDTAYAASGISYDAISIGTIHKSVDGGNTWTDLNMSSPQVIAMFFRTPYIGYYAAFGNTMYKTIDGALTWTIMNSPVQPDSDYIRAIHFLNDNVGYVATYNGFIYKTSDGGGTWKAEYEGHKTDGAYDVPLAALVATDGAHVVAIGSRGTVLKNDKPLSIPQKTMPGITAYPNPVIRDLTLSLGGAGRYQRILIFDAIGRAVCTKDIARQQTVMLDMHQYGSGCYILEVQGQEEKQILKVIVQ